MSWSTRIATSWQLLQRSWQVLQAQPRLVLFPVVSTLCSIVLALFFIVPIIAVGVAAASTHQNLEAYGERLHIFYYAYGAGIYLVSMFLATFFNVAFYNEIFHALSGEEVSLGRGLRFAATRWQAILLWSLLAGTVGLIIRSIEERLGWLGRIVMGFLGLVWSVAAVFAIPVIIRRTDRNPLVVLRDSASTLKRTWGESLIGFVGIQLLGVFFVATSLLFGIIGIVGLIVLNQGWLFASAIGFWLLAVLVGSFIVSIATHVYRCALYVFASEGVVPGPFTPEMMQSAWKVKKA